MLQDKLIMSLAVPHFLQGFNFINSKPAVVPKSKLALEGNILFFQACRNEESEEDTLEKNDATESDCHQLKSNVAGVKSAFITVYSTMPGKLIMDQLRTL